MRVSLQNSSGVEGIAELRGYGAVLLEAELKTNVQAGIECESTEALVFGVKQGHQSIGLPDRDVGFRREGSISSQPERIRGLPYQRR